MDIAQAILDGIIIGFIFNYGIYLLITLEPRGILHMLPKYFKNGGIPQTKKEKRAFNKRYIPILLFIAFVMAVNGVRVYSGTEIDFWGLFWHGYIVAMFMNIGDAVFLDILLIHTNREQYAKAYGLEDSSRLHAINFFKHLTFIEHCIAWPLLICPIIAVFFALTMQILI
ncbi:MAG: hypothetical protein GYA87_08620 [Christensenellaceae bacterium]|nr:hypothetical protein [Christensenellaceae bacterium]